MRKLPWSICCAVLTLQLAGPAHSQVVRFRGCIVDAEIWALPGCALETRSGHLYVSKRYLKLFFPTGERLASRLLPDSGWAYFNRQGLVVVKNVAQIDNGASEFHSGLVRVVRTGKWGLADSSGRMVVPFKYDGIYEYDAAHKGWKACTGCRITQDGEYSRFEDGEWFWLDRSGRVVGKAASYYPKHP